MIRLSTAGVAPHYNGVTCPRLYGRPTPAYDSPMSPASKICATLICMALACRNVSSSPVARADEPAQLPRDVHQLLKRHCIKCHGVAKREGELQLHTALRIFHGGASGKVVVAGSANDSLVWQRVVKDEMPPEAPLSDREKQILKSWIETGATGLPANEQTAADLKKDEHWAFTKLTERSLPNVQHNQLCRTPIDRWLQSELEREGLTLGPDTDRQRLIRRVSITVTGLPPTLEDVQQFVEDTRPDAYERLMERYLASPQYGVRWGGHWLEAAGYADSNGYFNADSDRPLAYRYRDYVVRSINSDKPFDQFVMEQLAGDELAQYNAALHRAQATEPMIDLLLATHYLRNGQDGTGESDGNADEVRIDRYTALESSQQIIASSLLGLTIQCAKCHDHKFEPITQRDFYNFQSVLFPAYNPDHWVKPNDRVIEASLPEEYQRWQAEVTAAQRHLDELQAEYKVWLASHRPAESILFEDAFNDSDKLTDYWTATIPGDDSPAGTAEIRLLKPSDTSEAEVRPAAVVKDGKLLIIEGGTAGDKWLSTKQIFDWTPDGEGQWIQVTFDLIADKVIESDAAAERIALGIALHDYNNNSSTMGGNLLVDGNPNGGAAIDLDYPGPSAKRLGTIGDAGYKAGRSYGIRLTRLKNSKLRLEQLVDYLPDGKHIDLEEKDLPDGSLGFEYCCGRSFIVDNVLVEKSITRIAPSQESDSASEEYRESLKRRQSEVEQAREKLRQVKSQQPGRIAWVTDSTPEPPDVYLLTRGNYSQPGDKVQPQPLTALDDPENTFEIQKPADFPSSGRRLAWARWVTRPGSRASHLMARVQVNRLWQHYFGTGLVASSENLGMSGAEPTNRQLLDWLAGELIRYDWNLKPLHRLLLTSTAFRQSSASTTAGVNIDPQNQLLWRYPLRRLDAEAIRDSLLSVSGDMDLSFDGPYIPTKRTGTAEVVVSEDQTGATRRSIYLQHRRSQGLSVLSVFDAPTIVVNCTRRPVTTMPLQSLTLLNSDFSVRRGQHMAERCRRVAGDHLQQAVRSAFRMATGRECSDTELNDALEFIEAQHALSLKSDTTQADSPDQNAKATAQALADFCQLLLASNHFLYLE